MVGSTNEEHMTNSDFIKSKLREDFMSLYESCDLVGDGIMECLKDIDVFKGAINKSLTYDDRLTVEAFETLRKGFQQILNKIAKISPVVEEEDENEEDTESEEGNIGPDCDLDEIEEDDISVVSVDETEIEVKDSDEEKEEKD